MTGMKSSGIYAVWCSARFMAGGGVSAAGERTYWV